MTVYYLDASAWVKRYFEEEGSDLVNGLFLQRCLLASAGLGYVETAAAIARQGAARQRNHRNYADLAATLDDDWQHLIRLESTGKTALRAVALTRTHKLRGADAVHLAVALDLYDEIESKVELIFVSADRELIDAAIASRLEVKSLIP